MLQRKTRIRPDEALATLREIEEGAAFYHLKVER
jgi:hypothetical protein